MMRQCPMRSCQITRIHSVRNQGRTVLPPHTITSQRVCRCARPCLPKIGLIEVIDCGYILPSGVMVGIPPSGTGGEDAEEDRRCTASFDMHLLPCCWRLQA
jgi:hypothetical protein